MTFSTGLAGAPAVMREFKQGSDEPMTLEACGALVPMQGGTQRAAMAAG